MRVVSSHWIEKNWRLYCHFLVIEDIWRGNSLHNADAWLRVIAILLQFQQTETTHTTLFPLRNTLVQLRQTGSSHIIAHKIIKEYSVRYADSCAGCKYSPITLNHVFDRKQLLLICNSASYASALSISCVLLLLLARLSTELQWTLLCFTPVGTDNRTTYTGRPLFIPISASPLSILQMTLHFPTTSVLAFLSLLLRRGLLFGIVR